MKRIYLWFPVMMAVTFVTAGAKAKQLSAREILAKMDQTIGGFKDQTMKITMTVKEPKGASKSYDFIIQQKGTEKRLVRFTSGEVKGMAVLALGHSRVFIYLPGFKKVRRVAAHAMNQSFAGSDFTNDDMAALAWSKICEPKLLKEDKDHWTVDCKPKSGMGMHYSHLIMKINKKNFSQDQVEYFDPDGKKIKVMKSSEPKDFHGVTRNSVVVMTDVRTGHSTRLDIKDFKVNQGLPSSIFTVRQLQWGM